MVTISKTNTITNLEIDFVMSDGKELKGCHSGEYPIDGSLVSYGTSKKIIIL